MVIFICCHVPRVIIDIWEFSYVEIIVQCNDLASEGWGHPFLAPRWIDCLTHFSHLTGGQHYSSGCGSGSGRGSGSVVVQSAGLL